MDEPAEISVVIPCYNSFKSLMELNERLIRTLEELKVRYEIIYVNDCSKDQTIHVLRSLSEHHQHITVIDLMFNVGQFRALLCGITHSSGALVVTMDDDLQHPPEEITKLYSYMMSNTHLDVVFGEYSSKKHSFFRNVGSFMMGKMNELTIKKPKNVTFSSFRCLRRSLVDTLIEYNTLFPQLGPLIVKSTSSERMANVRIHHEPRKYGQSNYSLFLLFKTSLNHLINFSSAPLKYISIFGVMVSLISIVSTFFCLFYKYHTGTSIGWTWGIILTLHFYSGLLLLSIGIIGEYLIRIMYEVKGFPKYKIREVYKNNK
ncbi:undecaprenyl-phosphate 4-deoxy-4-formamido-L-arabinose transferase [Aneurinibacillus soli]|uniref:Undecaprenyl-phosphate 4-deoxy-4-formamido-L-arabinose transferase n=1 Tax=Aneurinibacillus soli TaxID=1500254 RepID=A0A0U5AZX2_9BACL|nr:glycosyltransferase family 2 protein [Aneurinibacillus soli]PYE61534.1 undecaprenyl-phosphate 4-deoxy-4-formamido-L-arabinose transferase [Aneurinibacillus soli]BAU26511.1 Undecaprenyl-phosphate 4-deoxy-4-formamido-L-arabinose transferase [Aneurinibacillus soli]